MTHDINLATQHHVVHRVRMNRLVPNGSVTRMAGARAALLSAQAQTLYRKAPLDIDVRHGTLCRR